MANIIKYPIEREINGEFVEFYLEIQYDAEPLTPGKYYGPPENCYPDEGGYAELTDEPIMEIHDDGSKSVWSGTLTKEEKSRIEEQAYIEFMRRHEDNLSYYPDED